MTTQPRPGREPRAARRRAAGVLEARSPKFIDGLVSHFVLDDGRLVVAHAGLPAEHARPGLGGGALVRSLRRHHRRDRRVRAAGALPVGGGLPGRGDGRLRPHPGARGRLAQPDDLHRHRLRLRRPAHRLRYPERELVSVAGPRDVLRAGPAARSRKPADERRGSRPTSTSTTSSASGSSRRGSPARSRSARRTPSPPWR